ncbi:MAG: transcription termination factor Rho [Prevotella sp.]|nr:transcription termination factor Rho [Prevotella sp.]
MYTKEQLEQMDITQLMSIAHELGLKVNQNDQLENVIYDILDRAAESAANEQAEAPKRKRTRIAKKDTDRVYTVNGKDGENMDKKNQRPVIETPSLFKDEPAPTKGRKKKKEAAPEEVAQTVEQATDEVSSMTMTAENADATTQTPAPAKRRGRKSKAELAAIAAAEAAAKVAAEQASQDGQDGQTDNVAQDSSDNLLIPEANEQLANDDEAPDTNMLERLQERMAHRQADQAETMGQAPDGVWEGDPGDGTDFITVVDLPIEDQGALPTLDIFDRPVSKQTEPVYQPVAPAPATSNNARYDFGDIITGNGVLEILQDGYGFLRSSDYNYLSSPDDIFVSTQQIKKYSLKTGDVVECTVRPPHDGEKYFALSNVNSINGRNPQEVRDRVSFEHLTPLFPEEKFMLCGDPQTTNPSTRIVDLFAPIGKGQRALIVAQPKTGKTILMKDIANAIAANHPEAYIMMLLIDERPEEVTDMSRTVNAEVIASTFDEPADRHVKIAGIVLEKAKRMVECGHDVVIFLDSITRLARAYNTVSPASGKVLTGGVDANALQKPKRFFGAARKIEGGGSLTIIATALVDTGSKMDEVIFEEFKGTGNSEIQLDRMLSNKRIFPSLNLVQSSTRRDDLLQDQTTLNRMWIIRKFIAEMNPIEAMNTVYDRLVRSKDNAEFLMSMNG